MFKHILVPLDGSSFAEQVLPYVRTFASAFKAPVTLMQTYGSGPIDPADPSYAFRDRILESRRSATTKYLADTSDTLQRDGLQVRTVVGEGRPGTLIVAEAKKTAQSLIAMTTHGRSGIIRGVLGSVADKVLLASASPVLLIRSQEPAPQIKQATLREVIVPLDGSSEGEQSLPYVVSLAQTMKLKVEPVRVTASQAEYARMIDYPVLASEDLPKKVDAAATAYLNGVAQRLRDQGLRDVTPRLLHGNPANAIVEAARSFPDRIIVMATHGRSGVGQWTLGSVTDRVVQQSGDPVLVIRTGKKG